jgi:hypothetical protein
MGKSKRIKNLLFACLALLIGFSSGIGIKMGYEVTSFHPFSWPSNSDPIILNCYGDDFSELQLLRAIDFWAAKGHRIAYYEINPPDEVCEMESLTGFIILRKANVSHLDSATLASTTRTTTFATLIGATIAFNPGSQNLDLIIEHELGHAFGYGHVQIENHIMHPMYDRMGNRFWIP